MHFHQFSSRVRKPIEVHMVQPLEVMTVTAWHQIQQKYMKDFLSLLIFSCRLKNNLKLLKVLNVLELSFLITGLQLLKVAAKMLKAPFLILPMIELAVVVPVLHQAQQYQCLAPALSVPREEKEEARTYLTSQNLEIGDRPMMMIFLIIKEIV